MKFIFIAIIVFVFNISLHSEMSMKNTVLFGIVGSAQCKMYAEEVGGDVEAFSEMSILSLQLAEKLGYTKKFQSFQAEIHTFKKLLKQQLSNKYDSKLNAYNDWCIRFYNGFQNGIAKAYQ